MCGIVGAVGIKDPREYIINGLNKLQYRGYDSAGVAFVNNSIYVYKEVGDVSKVSAILPRIPDEAPSIGHTRWATHGKVSKINSHPHLSMHKDFCLVHNGVIENFLAIKNMLLEKGYVFVSQTDTEVVVNLIEYFYYLYNKDILRSIKESVATIKGSYAIAFIHQGEDDIYIMKNHSPLTVGVRDDGLLVASDISPMAGLTNRFIHLNDKEYGYISKDDLHIFNQNGEEVNKEVEEIDIDKSNYDKSGYQHFMLKEIEEINEVISRLDKTYISGTHINIPKEILSAIKSADGIIFLGCGTSYHASLMGNRYFEHIGIQSASFIASEWAYHPTSYFVHPLVILISQSGETADLIKALKIAKEKGYPTLSLTNVKDSSIYEQSDYSLLLYAGNEIAVASTKVYSAEVLLLYLLSLSVSEKNIEPSDLDMVRHVNEMIKHGYLDAIKSLASTIKNKSHVFFLGRGSDYYLALEASLKLKEISYIHSEAFTAGELKHGPIALIEKNTPVIVFISEKETAKLIRGNIEEVKSRGAKVFVITRKSLAQPSDDIILDDYPQQLTGLTMSSIAFYLAYYTSIFKNLDVDRPRNLAKSVTVE